MSFNGAGVFSRLYNWVNDKNASVDITASRMDAEMDGMATGLSNCLCKDGQQTATANQPMGGFKHTGVANASSLTDYAAAGQVQNSNLIVLSTVAGTNTITANAAITPAAYAAGQRFHFIAAGTCTGAVTLNISALGAKAIQKNGAALVAGDITAADAVAVIYDGTQFQMISPARTPVLTANSISGGSIVSSAALAGSPTTTTQTARDNSTKISTTAYTDTAASTIPQNSKSAAYTTVLTDAGKHIYHPSADVTARVWTIDSNANVAYPIGTAITFINDTSAGVITIAITSDTLVWAGAGTTGSRSLAASGMATAVKMTATSWMISGSGLS